MTNEMDTLNLSGREQHFPFNIQRSLSIAFIFFSIFCPLHSAFSYERNELIESRIDPSLKFQTAETKHFFIHYPDKLSEAVQNLIAYSDEIYARVSHFFGWELSEKVHLVFADRSDQVNLFTLSFPHQQIFIDASLPPISRGINEYANWHEWVLTHELGHVFQQEKKTELYEKIATIGGATAQPNMIAPVWFKEGLSTFLETQLTKKGRGDGSFYRMYLRQATLDNELNQNSFASLDTINSHMSPAWPWTLRAYLFGYYLVKKLETTGPVAAQLVKRIGSSFPNSFENEFQKITSLSLSQFWSSLLLDLKREFAIEIEHLKQKKITPIRYLTNSGFIKNGLTLAPNGKWLLTTLVRPEAETRILKLDLDSKKLPPEENFLIDRSTGSQISFSSSSRFIAFDQAAKVNKYYIFSDIAIFDLKEMRYSTISPGIRARDPDIHPDGKHLVFVLNDKGKNRLVATDTNWKNGTVLSGETGFSRISNPRFNSDGQRIIMTIHNDDTGGEDLVLYSHNQLIPLVSNGSLNFSPTWVPNRNQVLFSSDMVDGIFNIYILDLDKKVLRKLTHVLGGLFHPVFSLDLKKLYCISYRSDGYDVAEIVSSDLNLDSVATKIKTISKKTTLLSPVKPIIPAANSTYSGLPFLKPQYVTPSIAFLPNTNQIGFTVGAVDPLFFYHYEFTLRHDASTQKPVGRIFYYNGASEASWDVDINQQSFFDRESSLAYQKLSSQIGTMLPINFYFRNLYLRPHLNYHRVQYESNTSNLGPGISLISQTEFTQLGLSFPESGKYIEIGANRYFPVSSHDSEFTKILLKYRGHFQISNRWVYHLSLESGKYLASELTKNNGIMVGSKWSFPYSWSSEISMYGYPVNHFLAYEAEIITQRLTFSVSQIEKFFSSGVPVYFQRLSGGILGQVGRLDTMDGIITPWSLGLEIYQDFTMAHLFNIRGTIGIYRGETSLGGQAQFGLSLDHTF